MDYATFVVIFGSAAHAMQMFFLAQEKDGKSGLRKSGHGDVHGLAHLIADAKCSEGACVFNTAMSLGLVVWAEVAASARCPDCEKCGCEYMDAIYRNLPWMKRWLESGKD